MNNQFNGLSPAEAERLFYLLEELGEAQQAIGKILRHGYFSYNPDVVNGPNNREMLELELHDVFTAIQMLTTQGDLDDVVIFKMPVMPPWKYLHHQLGRIEGSES